MRKPRPTTLTILCRRFQMTQLSKKTDPMKTKTIYAISFITILFISGKTTLAQEVSNEVQTRTELELDFKPIKKVKLTFMPQLRFDEDFSLDKYLFETGVKYKALEFLDLGATYRFVVNPRDTKSTEYFNRYSFSATAKKEYGHFKPALRLRYSNYADDDVSDQSYFRYKASLKYDIPKCKFTPFVAAELFQQLDGGNLYKMRYSTGVDYKLFKKNYLGISYKFDYYNTEYLNKHIFSVGYKIKF